jgi:hypothetical protein
VLVSRYHKLGDTRVKFYVDRIDISDARRPRLVASVNTPGALLSFEPDTGRGVSYTWRWVGGGSCTQTSTGGAAASCAEERQSLQLLELNDHGARLLDGLELANGELVSSSARSHGVMLVALSGHDGYAPVLAIPTRAERLRRDSDELDVALDGGGGTPSVVAHGEHALVSNGTVVALLALTTDGSPEPVRTLNVPAWVQGVDLSAAGAVLALGGAGAQWVAVE